MEAAADAKMEYEQEPPARNMRSAGGFLLPAGKRQGLRRHIFNSLRVW